MLAGRLGVEHTGRPARRARIDRYHSVVDSWPTASAGDEVVVFGAEGSMSATDAAELIGTIGEEIALRVAPTIPRRYRDAEK